MAGSKTGSQGSGAAKAASPTKASKFSVPLVYRLFFLIIEPISALVGAYYAHLDQTTYLNLTHASSAPSLIPTGTSIVLSQLANLYSLFALNEALVLRSTSISVSERLCSSACWWPILDISIRCANWGHRSTGALRSGTPSTGEISLLSTWEQSCGWHFYAMSGSESRPKTWSRRGNRG